jgi:hypothetical protein
MRGAADDEIHGEKVNILSQPGLALLSESTAFCVMIGGRKAIKAKLHAGKIRGKWQHRTDGKAESMRTLLARSPDLPRGSRGFEYHYRMITIRPRKSYSNYQHSSAWLLER